MSLDRNQVRFLIVGAVWLLVVFLFPPWVQGQDVTAIERGRHFIGVPPARVGPEHFRHWYADEPDGGRASSERMAAAYDDPRIQWHVHAVVCGATLFFFVFVTFLPGTRARKTEKEAAAKTAAPFQ